MGYFYCIAGCKNFCTYVLVYYKELLKQANNTKVSFPCVVFNTLTENMTMDNASYHGLSNISDFLSQSFIPFKWYEVEEGNAVGGVIEMKMIALQ